MPRHYAPFPLDPDSIAALRFDTPGEVAAVEAQVEEAAAATISAIDEARSRQAAPLEILSAFKFELFGFHPLRERTGTYRALNIVEQINQTFSLLVALRAVAWLLQRHPGRTFLVDAGAGAVTPHDIVSTDGMVAAECFAAVRRDNNGKLRKDIRTIATSAWLPADAERHVFFHDRTETPPAPTEMHGDVLVHLHRTVLDGRAEADD